MQINYNLQSTEFLLYNDLRRKKMAINGVSADFDVEKLPSAMLRLEGDL
ncbi:hypothetical protein Ga0466249_003505 [Sporomusaceae bacterium BoRhaA]|nr:hypothetical protein [Pelorhabdus rhamnosifermentans]